MGGLGGPLQGDDIWSKLEAFGPGRAKIIGMQVPDDQTPRLMGPCLPSQLSAGRAGLLGAPTRCPLQLPSANSALRPALTPTATPLCLSGHLRLRCLLHRHARGLGRLLRAGLPQLLL